MSDRVLADQSDRDAAVAERARNVIIDAGAGTGKTSTLVRRLVNMVAPEDGSEAVPIERLAAVTFTNRAAGELRLRIREKLLEALGSLPPTAPRALALKDALTGLDNAAIGTIHSFADRLLRQRPVEAELSPEYEIFEDEGELLRETVQVLMRAAEGADLPEGFSLPYIDADALGAALRTALDAGIKRDDYEHDNGTSFGLEGLIAGFIQNRDVRATVPEPAPLDLASLRALSTEFTDLVAPLSSTLRGVRVLKGVAERIGRALDADDERLAVSTILRELANEPKNLGMKKDFASNKDAWRVCNAFKGGPEKNPVRVPSLRDAFLLPARQWLASRLVTFAPLAVELYEQVKARHRALDQVDLLLKLRDLLRNNKESRLYYQQRFDHVFVDEFQDTDPLQAEIVLFLCEDGAEAATWDETRLRPGKLTIVGDAKQSIYRFRRADVAMYDQVRQKIEEGGALSCTLTTNFRSVAPLIRWLNRKFPAVLGDAPDATTLFDSSTGQVYYQPLENGRSEPAAESVPAVHRVPFVGPGGAYLKADACRDLEGVALARYVRWIVGNPDVQVTDRETGERRTVRHGDIAVLALATYQLGRLFRQFDEQGTPHSVRGGKLFLSDDVHKRFLLGLRAIADRDDGTAVAALLRPPFFALDPGDLLRARAKDADPEDRSVQRVRDAEAIVRDLRRRRFSRPVGETARDLLERTAIADWVAQQSNGAQRLRHLREICATLELHAAAQGLDYDQATRRLRDWVSDPEQLDPPLPVGADAVQVVTVHQAKGLEFPVVLLWDGRAERKSPDRKPAWRVSRDGSAWAIALKGFSYEHPDGTSVARQEKDYRDHERARLIYVAATRARDLLVLPGAPDLKDGHIHNWFVTATPEEVRELEPYTISDEPDWSTIEPRASTTDEPAAWPVDLDDRWRTAAAASGEGRLRPVAVTTAAKQSAKVESEPSQAESELVTAPAEEAEDARAVAERKGRRTGRFGPTFGTAVHVAIASALQDGETPVVEHVERAARTVGLDRNLEEAVDDVERGLRVTRDLIAKAGGTPEVRLEYPVCGVGDDGSMLLGSIDLLVQTEAELHVIDFKTDAPPAGGQAPAVYVEQLRIYARLLADAGIGQDRSVRRALLFTADGSICEA